MTDDNTRHELAQLRARVAQLEAGQRPKTRHRRLRRFLPLLIAGLLVALMPLSILAATPFLDLNGGPDHADANANIDLIFNAGITKGCTPTEYCPNDFVNREQMASFLARTAGLGGNPPIANALTAQTVPNGSVTAAKLSPTGSTAGQVLTSTGAGVAWQTGARIIAGAVNANGSSQLPLSLYTVSRNAATHTYTLTFPAGTFTTPPANGAYPFCTFTPIGAVTADGGAFPAIAANGGGSATISFTDDAISAFICAQQNLP